MKRGIATPKGKPTNQVTLTAQEEEEMKAEWNQGAIQVAEKNAKQKKDQLNYANAIDKVCEISLMTEDEAAIYKNRLLTN